MEKNNSAKKPAREDWHKADIKAALEKAGWTLRRLGLEHGYSAGSLKNALAIPWVAGEKVIADAIGEKPKDIWPSRFEENNTASGQRCNVKQRIRIKHEQSQKRQSV